AVHLVIAHEFGVAGGCNGGDAGNPAESVNSVVDDLRSAVFAVAGVGGIEGEGCQAARVEADRLMAQVVECVNEEAGSTQEKDAERNLHADRGFAETLR